MNSRVIEWYSNCRKQFRKIHSSLQDIRSQIHGGTISCYSMDREAHYTVVKWNLEGDNLKIMLNEILIKIIGTFYSELPSYLEDLKAETVETINFLEKHFHNKQAYKDCSKADRLWRMIDKTVTSMELIQSEIELFLIDKIYFSEK